MIIAHRGVHDNKLIPENSLCAFQKALDNNYAIEFDIQITKDDKLVIFHDDNLLRMTGINNSIEKLLYEDVKNIKLLNKDFSIPTFKELLDLVNGRVLLDIEIKSTKRVKKVVDLVYKELKNYKGPILLKSFDPRIVKRLKKVDNKYPVGLLITYESKSKLLNLITRFNLGYFYTKPDFLAVDKKLLNDKFYHKYKKLPLFTWTVLGIEEANKLRSKYSDITCICNDL